MMDLSILSDLTIASEGRAEYLFIPASIDNQGESGITRPATSKQQKNNINATSPMFKLVRYTSNYKLPLEVSSRENYQQSYVTCSITDRKNAAGQFLLHTSSEGSIGSSSGPFLKQYHPSLLKWRTSLHYKPSNICKKVIEGYPFLNSIVHFRYKRLVTKSFVPFEPLFCNLSIYSVSSNDIVRVSETFRFDITSAKIKSVFDFNETGGRTIKSSNGNGDNTSGISNSRTAGNCIFSLPSRDSSAGLYLVLQVEKYLTDDPDTATLPYTKYLYPEQGLLLKKVKRLRNYRQPLGIAVMKMPGEGELTSPEDQNASSYSLHVMSQKTTFSDGKLASYIREHCASESRGGAEKLDLELQVDLRRLTEKDVLAEDVAATDGSREHWGRGAQEIAFLKAFNTDKLYQSVQLRESQNILFVYVKAIDKFKERNLSVKIQLVEFSKSIAEMTGGAGADKLPFATKTFQILKRLYSTAGDGSMMSNRYSTVSYHAKNPTLNDEFKVRLPTVLNGRMALRMTVRHVHVREMKATISTVSDILFASEESKPRYVEIGVAFLPLLAEQTPLRDGDHSLKVATPECLAAKQQQESVQETPLLLIGTRLFHIGAAACPWCEELLQLATLSPQALAAIDSESDISLALLKVIDGFIDYASEESAQKHFFRLLDVLLTLVTSGTKPPYTFSAVRAASFQAIIVAFYKACGYLTISPNLRGDDKDFMRDSQLLQGFAEFVYDHGCASNGRAAAEAHEVLIYYWALSMDAVASPPAAESNGGASRKYHILELNQKVVLSEIASHLFKIIFKSLAFKVSRENMSDSTKVDLDNQHSDLIVTFLAGLAALVAQMTDISRRRSLNGAVVSFIQSLLSFVIPMQVSRFLDVYLSSFDEKPALSSDRIQLKLEIWDLITSFDKFISLNFIPSSYDKYWLARKLIADVVAANSSASSRLKNAGAHIIRDLLCRQEYDALCGGSEIRRELACMYSPLLRDIVSSADAIAAMATDAPLRRDQLAILAYLVENLSVAMLKDEINALRKANLQPNLVLLLHLMLDTFEMSSVFLSDTEIDVFAAEHLLLLAPKFVVEETQAVSQSRASEETSTSPAPSLQPTQRRGLSVTGESSSSVSSSASSTSSAGIGGVLKAMITRRTTSDRTSALYTGDNRQSWASREVAVAPLACQGLVIDIECVQGAVRGVADGTVCLVLRVITIMLDGSAASDSSQLSFLLSVVLHGLHSSLSKDNVSSLYKAAALVVHKFGVRTFFNAVDDSLQDWMRVILRSNVSSSDACHFLFTILEFCYRTYGCLSHPRRALLGVFEDVMWSTIEEADYNPWIKNCADEILALEPLTTFVLYGAEEIAIKLSQIARAPAAMRASQDMANLRTFLSACKRLFDDLQLLLECQDISRRHFLMPIIFDFGGSNQLDASTSEKVDAASADIVAAVSTRRRDLIRASSINMRAVDYENMVEKLLKASTIFDPLQLPRLASRYLELACRLQEMNNHFVEANVLRQKMAALFDRVGPPSGSLCSALWMPRAPINWRRRGLAERSRAPSWLDTQPPSRASPSPNPNPSIMDSAAVAGPCNTDNGNRNFYSAYLSANCSPRRSGSPWISDKQYNRHIETLLSIAAKGFSAAWLVNHAELCSQLYIDRLRRQGRVADMVDCYRQLTDAFMSVAENLPPGIAVSYSLGIFYRLLIYGDAKVVPAHLLGQEFVVRSAERLNIGQFQDALIASLKPQLLDQGASITILSASKETLGLEAGASTCDIGSRTMFISLTSVRAHFDAVADEGCGDPSRAASVSNFSYELPLTMEGKIYAKTIDQQWKRVINLTTDPFPGPMTRQSVIGRRTRYCSPIECGIDNIDEQIVELQLEVEKDYDVVFWGLDKFRQSMSNLMRLVQGTMLPQVNGGIRDLMARFLSADSADNFRAALEPYLNVDGPAAETTPTPSPLSVVKAEVVREALASFASHQSRLRSRLRRCLELCDSLLGKSSRMLTFNFEATSALPADVTDLKQQIAPFSNLAGLAVKELKYFQEKLNAAIL